MVRSLIRGSGISREDNMKKYAYIFLKIERELKAVLRLPLRIPRIKKIVNKPSYYPEMPEKTRLEKWSDNIRWLLRDRLENVYYTSYGLNVKGFRNEKDFLRQREFIDKRNAGNQKLRITKSGDYNYIAMLRDKYVFASYLSAALGAKYIVPSIGIVDRGKLYLKDRNSWFSLDKLKETAAEFKKFVHIPKKRGIIIRRGLSPLPHC